MASRKGRSPQRKRVEDIDGSFRVHGRAPRGTGSVYWVEADSRWRASYRLAGDSRVRYVRGRTQQEAVERRAAAIAEHEARGRLSRFTFDTTVLELASWWLETVARVRVRPSSLEAIRTRLSADRLGSLGPIPVRLLTVEQVATWQAELLAGSSPLAPTTVADSRTTLRQVLGAAVDHGLALTNVVDRVKPPTVTRRAGRALTPDDARRLIGACESSRYGAAVALLFIQGWRVSEVLGLAWSDLDFESSTAHLRRAVVEVKGHGRTLGPPKTKGAEGRHILAPGIVQRLSQLQAQQANERHTAAAAWIDHEYDGVPLRLVFTQPDGSLVARQHIARLIRTKATQLGIDGEGLGTHAGRRSVVTSLYLAGEDIDDIARHVGHRSSTTTAGYVASLGERPRQTAARAAELLDLAPSEGTTG